MFLHQQSGIQNAGTKHAIVLCVGGCTSICSSSSVPALLALTRRADSRFATRLLILRLSASVKAVESGSPLYAIGRPAFFFFGSYRANPWQSPLPSTWVAGLHPSNEMCCRSAQVIRTLSYRTRLGNIRAIGGTAAVTEPVGLDPTAQARTRTRTVVLSGHRYRQDDAHLRRERRLSCSTSAVPIQRT